MTKLIVNADDFGYCESVNYGIVSSHINGIVTSTTIMPNMPGFNHAVKLLEDFETLGCGVHMTLSCNKPLNDNLKTLVDENGRFYRRIDEEVLKNIDLDELYIEFCTQIDKVIEFGVKITHLDSHHHVHTIPQFEEVIKAILYRYKLPIRGGFKHNFDYDKVVPCIGDFYNKNVSLDYFSKNLEKINSYEVCDLMSHPAFIENFLINSTSYAMERAKEHEILTSKEVKYFIKENDIKLVNYKNI